MASKGIMARTYFIGHRKATGEFPSGLVHLQNSGGTMNQADHLNIELNGQKITAKYSSTISQMLEKHPHPGKLPAVGAVVDNRISGLNRAIRHHAHISTIDTSSREGMEIYRRTAGMIFYAAIASLSPNSKVVIGQSLDEGYVFEPIGFDADEITLSKIETLMKDVVQKDIPLDPEWIPIEEAIQIFERVGRKDRVLLLRQMRRSEVPLLTIGNYTGYVHGPVAPRTGMINKFKLHLHSEGIVLEFPNQQGELAGEIRARPKLFATHLETRRWHELLNVQNIAQLNELTSRGEVLEVVKISEALHEKKIAAVADSISANRDVRFVFIAGPSSSGKTTFTKRLAIQLQVNGIKPIMLSMDDYFIDRDKSPLHPDGTIDLESVNNVDLKLFNQHLNELENGKEIATPVYSFQRGKRSERTHALQLKEGQVILIEGIHGLNPLISESLEAKHKFKIYVSALTVLCIDDHNRIFTSDTRLLRRIVRDRFFRGSSAASTIQTWPSVRTGERKWIFPHQEEADVFFNSALCYEHAVLKNYAERFLTEVPKEHPSYVEALRLFRFLDLIVPLQAEDIPHNSILREFIGRSSFRY